MKISFKKIINAFSITLNLAEISSISNTNIVEKITNINYSEHKFINHSQRTTYIALELAKKLNLSENCLKKIYISSLIHDIGATNFFNMSHSSDKFIKEHCIIGSNITKEFPIFNNISNIIMYHHENWNGSGPMGIKENSIPIQSQIIRIVDLIELLYEKRNYYINKKKKYYSL